MNIEPFTFILERVGQLLVDEIMFLSTDKKTLFQKLQQQLELAQSFVKDVEEAKEKETISNVLETEFQQVMLILPDIEDFLDTLNLEEAQQSTFRNVKGFFSRNSNPIFQRIVRVDTANKLISGLEGILERAKPYHMQGSTRSQVTRRRRHQDLTQPHIMNDEFIVGLDKDVESLVSKLKGDDGERTQVLAIVGMGGSGKTTLTRKLYNHEKIKRHFKSCLLWVCVSKVCDIPQLVVDMCAQLHIPVSEGDSSTARVMLQDFLHTSSCLVVLDDVWDKEVLKQLLQLLLPGGGRERNGRVLVTSRNEEIIRYPILDGIYTHKVCALNPEQSWDLFSKIIRREWQGIRSFDEDSIFAAIGKEMLERCHGLPLAIVALAGILGQKGHIRDWISMMDRVSSTILRENKGFIDYGPVKGMLELSYSDLPYELKPCFVYLGIFPEDCLIGVEELIQLWIGEGLVTTNMCSEDQTLEDLCMDFVNELVRRCTVQVAGKGYDENVETIQIHDLMRDLCIEKAGESGFFKVVSKSTILSSSKDSSSRRTIFDRGGKLELENTSRVRSVLKRSGYAGKYAKLEIDYKKMKMLRVLCLIKVDLRGSAEVIGCLKLLRYLRIEDCEGVTFKALESIKNLINLLTLVLELLDQAHIPENMVGGMKQLRYLHIECTWAQFRESLGVEGSKCLQCLQSEAGEWLSKELPIASFITTLRTLKLKKVHNRSQLDAVYDFIGNPYNCLQVLLLEIGAKLEFDLQEMKLDRCLFLESVTLQGRIRKQEGTFSFPPHLLSLVLRWSKIEKVDQLEEVLTRLHELRCLELHESAFEGDKLTMTGLPQLQKLKLHSLLDLKEWEISKGSLPQLKDLYLWDSRKLERIPEGISHIHNLQRFHAFHVSPGFRKRLEKPTEKEGTSEEGGGQDFHLIRHIPDVKISEWI